MDPCSVLAIPRKRWLRCFVLHILFSIFFWLLLGSSISHFCFWSTGIIQMPFPHKLIRFLCFISSQIVFLLGLGAVTHAEEKEAASVSDIVFGVLKLAWRTSIGATVDRDAAEEAAILTGRLQTSRDRSLFIFLCSISGSLAILSFRWDSASFISITEETCRGAALGLLYAVLHLFNKRMVLEFPVIQRPTFFCFKLGLKKMIITAIKLSVASIPFAEAAVFVYNSSTLAASEPQKIDASFIARELDFVMVAFPTAVLWEMCHHLVQILLTRRQRYAPLFGTSAAETSPSEMLLVALEESERNSLTHYLAVLDLCMLSEGNVDKWRLSALFEETGETYERIISECLKPLEMLTLKLLKGLDVSGGAHKEYLKDQSGQDKILSSHSLFNDYQLCSWCARIVAAVTAFSKNNDRYGVAQLKGCNGAVVSSLLSCLLVIEVYLGRRSSFPTGQSVGMSSIKWTTPARGIAVGEPIKKHTVPFQKKTELHKRAYAMADVLRTSLYQIVETFRKEMILNVSAQGSMVIAERDWLSKGQPLYGSHELHVHHLRMLLDFRM